MNSHKHGQGNSNSKENVLVKVPSTDIRPIVVYYPNEQLIKFCHIHTKELESEKGPREPIFITYLFFGLSKKDFGKKIISNVVIKKEICNYSEKLCFDVDKKDQQAKVNYELNIRSEPATDAVPIHGTRFHAHFDKKRF